MLPIVTKTSHYTPHLSHNDIIPNQSGYSSIELAVRALETVSQNCLLKNPQWCGQECVNAITLLENTIPPAIENQKVVSELSESPTRIVELLGTAKLNMIKHSTPNCNSSKNSCYHWFELLETDPTLFDSLDTLLKMYLCSCGHNLRQQAITLDTKLTATQTDDFNIVLEQMSIYCPISPTILLPYGTKQTLPIRDVYIYVIFVLITCLVTIMI